MARSAFAAGCCFSFLLATSGIALATPACEWWMASEEIEIAPGKRVVVGTGCYERRQGFPVYYDAPGGVFRGLDREAFLPVEASATAFESSAIDALGAMSISDLCNPFPAGQGEDDRPR